MHPKHTPNSNEIPYGYCHCGCGGKTNMAPRSSKRDGLIKGQPFRFILGHSRRKYHAIMPPNPSGLCACDCGTPLPRARFPSHQTRFIHGHNERGATHHVAKTPLVERFWKYLAAGEIDECWLWQGATSVAGYGVMTVDGKVVGAHRLSWELHNGPIPDGLHYLHKCDVNYPPGDISYRRCCNPHHAFLGTQRDNTADKVTKGRQAKGDNAPTSKLTDDQVREIRRRHADGATQASLCREYGIGAPGMSSIIRRVTWKHI